MAKLHTEIDLGLPSDTTPAPDLMDEFERLSSQIENDIDTASESLAHLYTLFSSNASASTITVPFERLENLVSIIRTQLAALAERNNAAKTSPNIGPASMKIRVNRFGKLAREFSDFLAKFEELREKFRYLLHDGIRRQVIELDPKLREADVDEAMRYQRKMDAVLERSSPEQRYQVDDLRARNRQLAKLNRDVAQLHEMFVELSFLTESQQTLINDVEANIKDTREDVEKADDELIIAKKIQSKIRTKQLIIAAIIFVILLVIILIIILQITS